MPRGPGALPFTAERRPTLRTFPTEAELRPQASRRLHPNAFPSATFPSGFSTRLSCRSPASSGELNYFSMKPWPRARRPRPRRQPSNLAALISAAPRLEPALAPDLISGTRAFDAHAIKRDFPILHQQVHGKPLNLARQCGDHAKAAGSDRPALALSTKTRTRTSIAAPMRSRRARPTLMRRRAKKSAASLARVRQRHRFRARRDRGHQSCRAGLGPPQCPARR